MSHEAWVNTLAREIADRASASQMPLTATEIAAMIEAHVNAPEHIAILHAPCGALITHLSRRNTVMLAALNDIWHFATDRWAINSASVAIAKVDKLVEEAR